MSRPRAGRARGGPIWSVSIPLVMNWDIFLRTRESIKDLSAEEGHDHICGPQAPPASLC